MTTPQKWVVRNVAKATAYDIATGKRKFRLTDLKTSGVENTAETVYARGGDGNVKIVGFSGNREARVNLESAVFDNKVIAEMTGNDIVTGAKELYGYEIVTVASNAATLEYTPQDDAALIGVYPLSALGVEQEELAYNSGTLATGEYSYTGKSLSFFASDLEDGTKVAVYYRKSTDATAQTITISSDSFAGSFKLVLDCLVVGTGDKKIYAAQIIIPTAKMEDNWSISMAAEGDPSVHTIPIEILKSDMSDEMYTMTVFNADAVV